MKQPRQASHIIWRTEEGLSIKVYDGSKIVEEYKSPDHKESAKEKVTEYAKKYHITPLWTFCLDKQP